MSSDDGLDWADWTRCQRCGQRVERQLLIVHDCPPQDVGERVAELLGTILGNTLLVLYSLGLLALVLLAIYTIFES